MEPSRRREMTHRASLAGNAMAGTAATGLGAAKLRDSYKEQYPKRFDHAVANATNRAIKQGVRPPHITRLVHIAQEARPGFKTLALATGGGVVAAGAHRYGEHLDHRARRVAKKENEKKSVASFDHRAIRRSIPSGMDRAKPHSRLSLHERATAARTPPPVARRGVSSTAVRSLGYQRPTRRLAVEMNSRPGEPYLYRVTPKTAARVVNAQSKGHAYATEIRHKAPRATRYTVSDRARLFADPRSERRPVTKGVSAFGVNHGTTGGCT